ncbi:MAG: Hsp20/alpha crystallin family protein [Desulfovibrionales bacterium]|nr:Hsp20/alpha crystallin family protein [Desulfovibrionales bacterium]
MQEDLFRLIEDVVRSSPFARTSSQVVRYRPVADVIEQEEQFIILVELSGIDQEDISIEVHGKKLIVYGTRAFPVASPSVSFHALEGSYGQFERQFILPVDINTSSIKAVLKSGLLMIFISKVRTIPAHTIISVNVDE